MCMKKLLLLLCLACFWQAGWLFAEGHNIKINVPKMANKQVILAFYRDKQVLAADTARLDANGNGAFQNPQKLAHGLYILYFSPSNIFDLIIGNNQNFSIKPILPTLSIISGSKALLKTQLFWIFKNS